MDQGVQSSTLKSYVSAIKKVLVNDDYHWSDTKICLSVLTKACKIRNDRILTRLPIQIGLFELLLGELEHMYGGVKANQPFLECLYKAMFCLAYYGLLRVGEITQSDHVVKAANLHMGSNKNKILIILYTSKTHGRESHPQEIKITAKEELQ